MKHKTPSYMRDFYKEDGRNSDRQTKMTRKAVLTTGTGTIVTISDQEAELVIPKSNRKCRVCSDPVAHDSYFHCKKHKPDNGDDDGNLIYMGVSGE